MNLIRTLAIGAVLGVGGLMSTTASAVVVCSGCDYIDGGNGTFLGTHNPTNTDQSTFTNTNMSAGAFTDTWVFNLNPAGNATVNAIFNPLGNVNNLLVRLYSATATCTNPLSASSPGSCGPVTLGSLIASGTQTTGVSDIGFTSLAAGTYAFVVTGSVIDGPSAESYSGNLNTFVRKVPEPGSLALLGLGLIGLGAARRRRI